ncbi:MAG: T9SS type A sorting domain-containing protein [Bacteroidales bacterium]
MKIISYTFLIFAFLSAGLSVKAEADWTVEPLSDSNHEDLMANGSLAIGSDGTYHVVFLRQFEGDFIGPGPSQVLYMKKTPGEEWSQIEFITPDDEYVHNPSVTVTNDGSVYVAYQKELAGGDFDIVLAARADDDWDLEVIPASASRNTRPCLTSDEDGHLHIVWNTTDDDWNTQVAYAHNMSGDWNVQNIMGTANWDTESPSFAVSPNGVVHLVFVDTEDELKYATNTLAGGSMWSMHTLDAGEEQYSDAILLFDDNTIHVAVAGKEEGWGEPSRVYYFSKEDDVWTDAEQISEEDDVIPLSMSVDEQGKIWLACLELGSYGDTGSLIMVEKDDEGNNNYDFPATEDADILHAIIGFDSHDNHFVVYNEVIAPLNSSIFFACQETPSFTVTFDIQDEQGAPVEDATITLNGIENEAGDYTFNEVESGAYSFTVEADGFLEYTEDNLEVDEDTLVEVTLTRETFVVTFSIRDEQDSPVNDAIVTLGDTTNEAGDYVFEEVEEGTYSFAVEADGFLHYNEDNLEVSAETMVDVTLTHETFDVTFVIEDEHGNAVTDAVITIGELTNEAGDYVFPELLPGVYEYSVQAEGFFSEEGACEVDGGDLELVVELTRDETQIHDLASVKALVFPNPVQDDLHIRSEHVVLDVAIIDMAGSHVRRITPGSKDVSVQVSDLKAGIYVVQVTTSEGVAVQKVRIR